MDADLPEASESQKPQQQQQQQEDAPATTSAETAAAAAAAPPKQDANAANAADEPPPVCDLGADIPAAPSSSEQEGVERITPDGLVLKVVLEEGEGELPALHSQCLVHFVGRVLEEQKAPKTKKKKSKDEGGEGDGANANADEKTDAAPPPPPSVWAPAPDAAPFMDTRDEGCGCDGSAPVQLVAGRRVATGREAGLSLALAKMRRGERALVYVLDPSYGYGPKGSFSFPSVPPNSRLAYDVRMVAWEAPDDGEEEDGANGASAAGAPRRGLLFEERLEAAERRRLRGNARFAAGDLPGALSCYAFALSYVDDDLLMQLEEGTPHLKAAEAVLAPTHLNIAAAHLSLKNFEKAIEACGKALEFDEGSAKAYFRRGKARLGLGQTREAVGDLDAAQRLLEKQQQKAAVAAAEEEKGATAAVAAAGAGAAAAAAAPSSSSLTGDAAAVARELAAARRLLREEGRAGDRVLTAALRKELGPSAAAAKKAKAAAAAAEAAAAEGAAATAAAEQQQQPASSSSSLMAMLEVLLKWLWDLLRRVLPVATATAAPAAS